MIRSLTFRSASALPAAPGAELIRPRDNRPAAVRGGAVLTARAMVLGLAAVLLAVLLLWLTASAGQAAPIDPTPPVAPTDPANPGGGSVNIEINGLDGKPSTFPGHHLPNPRDREVSDTFMQW